MLKYILLLLFLSRNIFAGGGGSVFSRDNVELVSTSLSILGCIIFTLLMEIMLHKLEHKANHDPAKKAFLHKIYEEMITLGFFSFGLILLIDFKVLSPSNPNLQKFEFAHLWLFMFGIFLVMHNLVGFVVIHKNERNWIRADAEDFETLLKCTKKFKSRKTCCRLIFGGGYVNTRMEYQIMKHIFLSQQGASTFDFRFAKYLQRATSRLLMEHLENISIISWLILVAVGIAYIAVITSMRGEYFSDLWFSFAFGWVLAFFSILLMMSVRVAKTNLIKKYAQKGKKYEPKDYPDLMEHIQKLQTDLHEESKAKFASAHSPRRHFSIMKKSISNEIEPKLNDNNLFFMNLKTANVLWLNDMITLLQCFFLGLFSTLISIEAIQNFGTKYGILYIFAVLLEQGVVMLWSSPSTVKDVVLILSTLNLDKEIYREVMDETAELLNLRKLIKKRIEDKWPSEEGANRETELKKIFADIDLDKSNLLGCKELKELFKKLSLTLHSRQCDLIIEEMDKDLSGEVNIDEFTAYLNVNSTDDFGEVNIEVKE